MSHEDPTGSPASLALAEDVRRLVDASPSLVLSKLQLEGGRLVVRWTVPAGGAVSMEVGRPGDLRALVVRGRAGLRYEITGVAQPLELRDAVLAAAEVAVDVVDGWLEEAGAHSLASRLDAERPPPPASAAELLDALGLTTGTELGAGFSVVDATAGPPGAISVDLRGPGARARVALWGSDRVELIGGRVDRFPPTEAMLAAFRFLAASRLHPAVSRRVPLEVQRPSGAFGRGPSQSANAPDGRVQVNSDCGQHCEFCSIPETYAPRDSPLAELVAVLQRAREAGSRTAVITGVDPLAHPEILELVSAARALGFERLDLYGPGRRLADRAFAERIVQSAVPNLHVFIPLYGATAAVHDKVVSHSGAFAEVMRALDHLLELVSASSITLMFVCTRNALPDLPEIARLAEARGVNLSVGMPLPDSESRADPYFDIVPTMTEVARSMLAGGMRTVTIADVAGMAPCVIARAILEHAPERREEVAMVLAELARHGSSPTRARTGTISCIHRSSCPLAPPCAGEVLGAYVRCHGSSELVPIDPGGSAPA